MVTNCRPSPNRYALKNVRVIDCDGYSANRNDLFDGDGTHPSTTGTSTNPIHDAVKKDLPVHPEDHVRSRSRQVPDALVNALSLKPHKLGTDRNHCSANSTSGGGVCRQTPLRTVRHRRSQ